MHKSTLEIDKELALLEQRKKFEEGRLKRKLNRKQEIMDTCLYCEKKVFGEFQTFEGFKTHKRDCTLQFMNFGDKGMKEIFKKKKEEIEALKIEKIKTDKE